MPTKVTVKWMTNLVYGILSVLKLNVVTGLCYILPSCQKFKRNSIITRRTGDNKTHNLCFKVI